MPVSSTLLVYPGGLLTNCSCSFNVLAAGAALPLAVDVRQSVGASCQPSRSCAFLLTGVQAAIKLLSS
jgi:hypothetical protein